MTPSKSIEERVQEKYKCHHFNKYEFIEVIKFIEQLTRKDLKKVLDEIEWFKTGFWDTLDFRKHKNAIWINKEELRRRLGI